MTPAELLVVARRRLRRVRVASRAWERGWIALLAATVALLLARTVPWPWLELAAVVVPALCIVVSLLLVWLRPLPDLEVAQALDAGLGSRDALSADLEFGADAGHGGDFAERISRRARAVAAAADTRVGLPGPGVPRRPLTLGVIGVLLVGTLLWVPNPQDAARERRRVAAEATEQASEELREAAEQLPPGQAADSLLRTAAELETARPQDALAELSAAQAELARAAGADLQAARAATDGLERSMAAKPLPGAGADPAAAQLRAAAAAEQGLSAEERSELAGRLTSLASTQVAGAPEVAEALRAAAEAVATGQPGAAEALEAAADAQAQQSAEVADRSATAAAAASVGAARERLAGQLGTGADRPGSPGATPTSDEAGADGSPGDGQGPGKGSGQGPGKGSGQGQGSGQGEGTGSGAGQGSGAGKGTGSASGNVSGGDRSGSGSGTGGSGQVGTGGGQGLPETSPGSEESPPESDVFAPPPSGTRSGEGTQLGDGGRLDSRVGTGDTTTERSVARLPLSEALQRYRDGVRRAAEAPGVPSAQRGLISDYFARLTEGN